MHQCPHTLATLPLVCCPSYVVPDYVLLVMSWACASVSVCGLPICTYTCSSPVRCIKPNIKDDTTSTLYTVELTNTMTNSCQRNLTVHLLESSTFPVLHYNALGSGTYTRMIPAPTVDVYTHIYIHVHHALYLPCVLCSMQQFILSR